jgi:hypothetical protein
MQLLEQSPRVEAAGHTLFLTEADNSPAPFVHSVVGREQLACQRTIAWLDSLLLLKTVVILVQSTMARHARAAGEVRKLGGAFIRCLKVGQLGEIQQTSSRTCSAT